MKVDLVEVEWLDHVASMDGWHNLESAKCIIPTTVKSVGYVIADNKDSVVLSSTIASPNEFISLDTEEGLSGHTFCIVKSCITKRKVLKKVEL